MAKRTKNLLEILPQGLTSFEDISKQIGLLKYTPNVKGKATILVTLAQTVIFSSDVWISTTSDASPDSWTKIPNIENVTNLISVIDTANGTINLANYVTTETLSDTIEALNKSIDLDEEASANTAKTYTDNSVRGLKASLSALKTEVESYTDKADNQVITDLDTKFTNKFADYGVDIRDYGAVCDGITDDSKAIQKAIDYCYTNQLQMTVPYSAWIYVAQPLYIPNNTHRERRYIWDFNGARFRLPTEGTLFISSSETAGLHTSVEDALDDETTYCFNTILTNFHINGGRYGLKLGFWHYGCEITNITMDETQTALVMHSGYYCIIRNVATSAGGQPATNADRFIFKGVNNLMTIEHCVVANSNTGYFFDGYSNSMSSIRFLNNSTEGTVTGVKVNAQMYNCLFDGTYAEAIHDCVFDFTSVQMLTGVIISNSWVNFDTAPDTAVFIKNVEYNGVNRITLEPNNYFRGDKWDDTRLFSNKLYGTGLEIKRPPKLVVYNNLEDTYYKQGTLPYGAVIDQEVVYSTGVSGDHGPIGKMTNIYGTGTYSGKMTDGTDTPYLVGMRVSSALQGVISLDTAMYPSSQQVMLFAFSCKQTDGTMYFTQGIIMSNKYYEITNTGLAIQAGVQIFNNEEFVKIKINKLATFTDNALKTNGGFLRQI